MSGQCSVAMMASTIQNISISFVVLNPFKLQYNKRHQLY